MCMKTQQQLSGELASDIETRNFFPHKELENCLYTGEQKNMGKREIWEKGVGWG